MTVELKARFTFYPAEAVGAARTTAAKNLNKATNFLRRTVKKMVGFRGPLVGPVTTASGATVYYPEKSAPDDPPYMQSGTLQSHVGYNAATKTTMEGRVNVDSYGMEAGIGQFSRIKHPHLVPAYELNKARIARIAAGEDSGEGIGEIGPVHNRPSVKARNGWVTLSGRGRNKVRTFVKEFVSFRTLKKAQAGPKV